MCCNDEYYWYSPIPEMFLQRFSEKISNNWQYVPFILYLNFTYWILIHFQKKFKKWINLIKVSCIYQVNMPQS